MPDSSSRNWWSRSKPGPPQKSAGISLNSIVSAIGLKSKKQRPSLAIQDPPSSSTSDRPSLARSRVDSIGPPTPVDYDYQSLLTISDNNPFAGRQNIPPVPKIPSQKTLFDDINFGASSLSLSTNQACDPSTLSPTTTESCELTNKRSFNHIPFSRSLGYTDRTSSFSSKRPSSSTAQIHATLTKPKLRARGMTDGGSTRKAGFFLDELSSKKLSQQSSISTFCTAISSTEHTSPRPVIRKASQNRLIAPPCAPPAHSLPETPHSPMRNQIAPTESGSPSCMSFASSSNDMLPAMCYSLREKRYSERKVSSQDHHPELVSTPPKRESKTTPSSPRKLKKAISHQSLSGKFNAQPPTLPKLPQRIDHPVPNPVGPVNSTKFPSLLALDTKVAPERSTSGKCSLNRKKIFSEDDSVSIFSSRSDHSSRLVPLKPLKANPQSSFWDEAGSPESSSSARFPSEYTPQHILSAAEVAKLEASITNSPDRSTRSRTFSLLSASTTASDRENAEFTPAGLSPSPITKSRGKPGSIKSVTSKTSKTPGFSSSLARSPTRSPPQSINGNPENDPRNTITFQPFSSQSPTESMTSLPPPPRPRQRSQLTYPPERSNPVPSSSFAKPSRSKSTNDKNIHRRSIMKKPSFLEIDDDDTDPDFDLFSGEAATESFLDLARESYENSLIPA